jgi:chromosome segregation ATPase
MAGLSGMYGQLGADGAEADIPVDSAAPDPVAPDLSANARIGEANEALRNLLVDAKLKLLQFDDYKAFFTKLIEPATQALRTLEQEQTANTELRRRLGETAARSEELQARLRELEAQRALLDGETGKLRGELELARTEAHETERARAEIADESLRKDNAAAEFERRLALETARSDALSEESRQLRDENQRQRDQAALADEKSRGLATELSAARDRIGVLEDDALALQASLDQAAEQEAHSLQRLAGSETALTAARARLAQLEAINEELRAEHDKLRAALAANGIRHDGQQSRIQMQVDAARARAAATEKLLTEARQQLAQRGEEMRATDQRHTESSYAREQAEKRAAALETELTALRSELTEVRSGRDRLVAKSNVMVNALKLREAQLQRAEQAAQSATERNAKLEAKSRDGTDALQRRIEQLTSALERERLERQVTSDALDAARKERDHLQTELLRLQLEANRRAVSNAGDDVKFPSHGANAA